MKKLIFLISFLPLFCLGQEAKNVTYHATPPAGTKVLGVNQTEGMVQFDLQSGNSEVSRTFNQTLTFDQNFDYGTYTQTGNIVFTLASSGNVNGKYGFVKIIPDGTHTCTFPVGSKNFSSRTFDTGSDNYISFEYRNNELHYKIFNSQVVSGGSGGGGGSGLTLSSAATNVSGNQIVLSYSTTLASVTPATGDFTTSPSKTISSVVVSGTTVTLTVSSAFTSSNTITVSYVPGTNKIQDGSGNLAAALTNQAVTNNVTSARLLDNFTRSNSTSSLGSAVTGQAWSAAVGTWGISSNQAYCASATASGATVVNIATIDAGVADYTMTIDVTGTASSGNLSDQFVLFRYSDINNHYLIECIYDGNFNNYGFQVYKKVSGGSYTALTTSTVHYVVAAGTPVKIKVVTSGSSITVAYVVSGSDNAIWSGTDAFNSTATMVGIGVESGSVVGNANARFDNLLIP